MWRLCCPCTMWASMGCWLLQHETKSLFVLRQLTLLPAAWKGWLRKWENTIIYVTAHVHDIEARRWQQTHGNRVPALWISVYRCELTKERNLLRLYPISPDVTCNVAWLGCQLAVALTNAVFEMPRARRSPKAPKVLSNIPPWLQQKPSVKWKL